MQSNIIQTRNFSIIAHIDHGKSTLADRMLELTNTVEKREMKERFLDTLELEQEKGITIKLQTVRMNHKYTGEKDEYKGKEFILNLIDTPGHVDFSYEVSRSLAACEGAILVVDATQGIQAQTITTVYKALEYNLNIIPVINKVDLPTAMVEQTIEEIVATFGFEREEIVQTSGKTGIGVIDLLNRVVEAIPSPKEDESSLKALIFDSFYNEHKGVIALAKIFSGSLKSGEEIKFGQNSINVKPIEIGYLTPNFTAVDKISCGEVCYIATGLKDIKQVHVGDTALNSLDIESQPLPGYKQPKSMVFASLYPVEADDFQEFSAALEKLALNDAALYFKREHSQALGSGYLCGFLGLLHLEITMERLYREFDIDLISTTPSVEYKVKLTTTDFSKLSTFNPANYADGILSIHKASEFPDPTLIETIDEPWSNLEIVTPDEYIGSIMELTQKHRAIYKTMEYITESSQIHGKRHVMLKYLIPTAEIITNFFDTLKSVTQGYASMDYEFKEFKRADIVKVNILINAEVVEALSFLTHRTSAETRGRKFAEKLKEIIPKQNFKVPIQAEEYEFFRSIKKYDDGAGKITELLKLEDTVVNKLKLGELYCLSAEKQAELESLLLGIETTNDTEKFTKLIINACLSLKKKDFDAAQDLINQTKSSLDIEILIFSKFIECHILNGLAEDITQCKEEIQDIDTEGFYSNLLP